MSSMSQDSSPLGAVRIDAATRAPLDVAVPPLDPLPRRSFLTGRVLDPELHPPLRRRLARAMRREPGAH
jgi:hypothetical protein